MSEVEQVRDLSLIFPRRRRREIKWWVRQRVRNRGPLKRGIYPLRDHLRQEVFNGEVGRYFGCRFVED